jgi:hypothetical protein
MKKTFKILGIIALVVAIWFSMAACKSGDNYPDPPKQFIIVGDIPEIYKNKYGFIVLSPPDSTEIIIYSSMERINTTSTFSLYIWGEDDPWEGSGNFCVKILIYESTTTENWTYAGVTEAMNITEKNTNISWGSFTSR